MALVSCYWSNKTLEGYFSRTNAAFTYFHSNTIHSEFVIAISFSYVYRLLLHDASSGGVLYQRGLFISSYQMV